MKKINKLLMLSLMPLVALSFIGCDVETSSTSSTNSSNEPTTTTTETKTTYGLNDEFEFDDLKITLTNISFTTVDNEFSDYYEKDIVKVSTTIKNVGKSTNSLNMFYFKIYGSKGTSLDSVEAYFDDSLGINSKDIAVGSSVSQAFYMPYDGDGKYKIEFSDFFDTINAEFNVSIGNNSIENKKTTYSFGEEFRYHFFMITAGDISFTTVDNEFSDYYQKDIVRIPLTIKNVSDESQHLNPYSCTILGSKNVEVDTLDTYFDDSIGWGAKDLATGASYTRAFYAAYDGNGSYTIEFGDPAKVKLVINVNK